jgi:hypothetical protein
VKSIILFALFCLFVVSCKKEESPTQTDSKSVTVTEKRDSITANYQYSQVISAAIVRDSTVRFKGIIGNNLNTNGTSHSWSYKFGMTVSPFKYYHFTAVYDSIKFDSTSRTTTGDAFITHTWINSCNAMDIAEANGGMQFRTNNPDYTVRASLGEAVVPNAFTYWYITYRSNINSSVYLNLTIDATTGIVK